MKFLVLILSFACAQAFAQTAEEKVLGWKRSANLGANLSFSSSQDVVGQTDGNSETYGLNLKGNFVRTQEWSEWKTDASYLGNTTRTPNIDRYTKSGDELKLETAYLYFWNGNPNFGPYARANAAAPVFKGENVQSEVKTYSVTDQDGTNTLVTGDSIRLTDGFKPLTTKESIGVFWRPITKETLKVETRLGFAALQVSADGQYTVKGTNAAGQIEVEELADVSQTGIEASIVVKGTIDEKSAYELGAEAMTPLASNKESADDRDALRLTNVDAYVKLTSNITSWASFGYDYKLKIQPQLVDRAQQIHMLVINVNYNLF